MVAPEELPGLRNAIINWYGQFFVLEMMFFVLSQKRELDRFFIIQDLKKKQIQMENVFDAQTNAVVVVNEDACHPDKEQPEQQEEEE